MLLAVVRIGTCRLRLDCAWMSRRNAAMMSIEKSGMMTPAIPSRIGPCELSPFGEKWVAVRCPTELVPLMREAGGFWQPGSRRWLIERRRIGPLVRKLERATDPLFRQAGISLDER